MEEVVNLISTCGFPIAMCLLMFWRMEKSDLRHNETYSALKTALDNNTLALQEHFHENQEVKR